MSANEVLSLSALVDQPVIGSSSSSSVHLIAEVSAVGGGLDEERPPIAAVLAIDTSSSMLGEPLRQVVRSAEQLVGLLRPTDQVGLVCFSSRAELAFAPCPVTEQTRQKIVRKLRSLRAGGNTNIQHALEVSAQSLDPAQCSGRRSVLLLSDGAPTIAESRPDRLVALARRLRSRASITTLGYGESHDEAILSAISDAAGGAYHFIPDPAVCQFQLAKALGSQGDIVAEDVKLRITPSACVKIQRLLPAGNLSPGSPAAWSSVRDLSKGDRRLFAAELRVSPPLTERTAKVAEVELVFRLPGSAAELRLSKVVSVEIAAHPGPKELARVKDRFLLEAEERRSLARCLAERGEYRSAASLLRGMIAEIEALPSFTPEPGSPLFEACEQLLDEAVVFEQNPTQEAYRALARSQRGALFEASNNLAEVRERLRASSAMQAGAMGPIPHACFELSNGQRVTLRADNVIGRSRTCDVCIPSSSVSRQHAQVFALEGDFFVADLGSSGGVFANGQRIEVHCLSDGDRLEVGDEILHFRKTV